LKGNGQFGLPYKNKKKNKPKMENWHEWIGLCSVLRPRQHSIGYMGDSLYRSKDPTNSIKVLKEMLQRTKRTTKTTKYT